MIGISRRFGMQRESMYSDIQDDTSERRDQGQWHQHTAKSQKAPAAYRLPFAPQRHQPENRRQGTRHGQIGPQIHAHEQRSIHLRRQGRTRRQGSGDQTERQIIDQVARQGDDCTGTERSGLRPRGGRLD